MITDSLRTTAHAAATPPRGLLALAGALLTLQGASAATVAGRIAGAFEPAANGAATYTIPIQVAAGMNGLKPSIALSYDSHAGNGLAGMGWTVSGLSQIHRCPLTRALDGRAQGVRLNAQDRFCLDGAPLVLLSGVYGANAAVYRTEVHSYERVISYGQQGTGPSWFEVRRPDGTVHRYGNDADSRVEAPGTAEVRAWALNEIEDKFQQRIGFNYTEDSTTGEHRPAEILWSYGAAESPQQARYRIAFSYATRPTEDIRSGYAWASPWRSSKRLTYIDYDFRADGGYSRVHRYTLAYATPTTDGTKRSQLARITQCGPRDCLPSTTLLWDNGVAGWENHWQPLYQPVERSVHGDFNGDGTADIFGDSNGYWAAWPADPQTGLGGAPVAIPAPFGADGSGLALDYNGDGFADLLARASATSAWVAYLTPGTAGGGFEARETGASSTGNGETVALDIDADGFDDLVYLRNGTAWLRRNLGGALGPEKASGIGSARAPYVPAQGAAGWLASADFDGDGREDLLVARSRDAAGNLVWEAYLSNGGGFDPEPIAILGSTAAAEDVIVLDMNGDGLADVLRRDVSSWIPHVSRGAANGATSGLVASSCSAPLLAGSARNTVATDYDGDGRADLLMPYGSGWRVYRSDGACFSRTERYADVSGPNSDSITRVVSADRDGDGNSEILFGTLLKSWQALQHRRETRGDGTVAYRADLLREVADGLGNSHELRYRVLAGWDGYGLVDTPAPASSRLLPGAALAVLSEWSASSGEGTRYSVALTYTSLRADTLGRGLLGFQGIRATDSRSRLVTETSFRQDFPFIGRPERVTVWNDAAKLSVYDPAWAVSTTAAPDAALDTHFVHLASDATESYEVDRDGTYHGNLVRNTVRTLSWNFNHGAVTSEQTVVSAPQDGSVPHRTTRSVTLDEGLRGSAGCLGFPSRIDVTREAPGSEGMTRTVQFGYSSANCRTVTETSGPAGSPSQQLRTSYAYDALGRLESITRTDGAGLLAARQTRLAYAASGSRPVSEAQAISGEADLVTTRSWNDALGLEASRSVPAGTTAWNYDDFGRLRSELRPSGNTQTTYSACGPCFAPHARYSVRQLRSDGYWSETQHDGLGRVVGRSFVLSDNHASRQVLEYDPLGRLARESLPYRDDEDGSAYWTSYQYDPLGRVKSIDRPVSEATPSGALTSFTYAGLELTMRDAEMRTTRALHDAEGRLKIVIPPLGSNTGYTYTAFGELNSILDAGWNSTYFDYDARGLLVQSVQPDAGRRTYAYNAFGELVSQTDGKSPANTMTLQYDQLGRLTRRTEPEGTTNWNYVSAAGPSRGRLQQVTGPGESGPAGFRESYSYDNLGRVQTVTTVIDGSSYQTDYGYDAENNLASMTYPATVGLRPKFRFGYSSGHLARIFQEGVTLDRLYTLLAMNAMGREVSALFGNAAILERNSYDRASMRLTAIRSGPPTHPESLQDYAYDWDRVGNLLSRRSLGADPPLEERFAYDDLNRLKQATLNGIPTLSIAYRADGNVRSKSDVGNYAYSLTGEHPHAVAAIGGGPQGIMTFAYDANGNMTNRNGATLSWASYNLPRQITAGADYARFSYGPGRGRIRQDLRSGTTTKTIHYVGPHFEVEIQGTARRYRSNVFAHGRAIYSQVEASGGGLEGYYVLHDHLGSVDRLARAVGSGSETLSLSFDAWGKRRNADWSADPADTRYADAHWVERGFTGHEHLDHVRLIHMNGRLEDPMLGRMLSPDPVTGNLMNPQTLNPYSYAANGPTSYADPSGYFLSKLRKAARRAVRHIGATGRRVVRRWGREIAAVVAAYYSAGAVSSWAYAAQTSAVSISGPAFLSADGIAAASTLSAAATSSTVIGGMAGGALAGAIASGDVEGTAVGALTGGAMAGIGAAYGGAHGAGRVLAEAGIGGVSAELRGGDFANGFVTSGALSSLTWAALEMRQSMIRQSRLNEAGDNASGISAGFRGDGFKLGGCRSPCDWSPLGGVQGRAGNVLGIGYGPGSFLDRLVETYAGPHDFLNSPVFYDELGNSAGRWAGLEVLNAANVLLATPFAAASVMPSYAYGIVYD